MIGEGLIGEGLIGESASNAAAPFDIDVPILVAVEWIGQNIDTPIVVEVGGGDIEVPLHVEVASGATTIEVPLTVQAAAVQSPGAALTVRVLDPAVLAGLDGAAGWAAAPDGRWQAHVWLGGEDISERVAGVIEVRPAADEARSATFAFRPAAPLAPMGLIRKRVRIAFADGMGINVQPMFAGVVVRPTLNLQTGLITCECTDDLQNVVAAMEVGQLDTLIGGRYHPAVSASAPADNWAYAQARIEGVPASLALDVEQRLRVLPWDAPARTLTVRDADIIEDSLTLDLPTADALRTRIGVRLQYRYTRLRGRGIVASWAQPFSFFAWRDVEGIRNRRWLLKSMVAQATESLPGWTLRALPRITHPQTGVYLQAGGTEIGYSIPRDVAPDLVLDFAAQFSTRWAQVVTETYAITVSVPGVEQAVGPVAEQISATLAAPFEQSEWLRDEAAEPVLSIPPVGDVIVPWQPEGGTFSDRDELWFALLDRAYVRLRSGTRTGRVRFALPLRPDIWLDTGIQFEGDRLRAAGDVVELAHTLNTATGRATTEVALAVGLPGNTSAAPPVWPDPAPVMPDETRPVSTWSCEIGTFVGLEEASPPFDEETMIGFSTNRVVGPGTVAAEQYEIYPHQLSIRAPDIAAEDRDPLNVEQVAHLQVAVPTSLLEIQS